ncbi:dephospho-CoA kinase [Veillonella sp. S13053-19]|uniref:dephospho-CoA kinase n=1 Tax=Veillonella sp. S13053-19 TaxID=2027456 RepID=UPI000CF4BD50|nr:dephospho-CoA kinase [Veillonella sp. S13053-19]PQL16152.1 dephospho-CoA kinase [Veillonella sp. S13053-19]
MFKIGLTGGIASGKSTVLTYFKDKGIPYIDADIVAREVVEPGTEGLEAIVDAFGSNVLHDDGTLNREALGAIVFHNEEKRRQLNDCLKEHIRNRIMELTAYYESNRTAVLIYDIPLLIEGEWYTMMDEVWLVYVNESTQIERLMSRNGFSKKDALARINSQMRLDDKRSFADVIINNSDTPQALTAQLDTIWSERLELLLQKSQ